MLEKVTSNWWKFAIRGLVAIILGIVALVKPGQTLQVLVLAFGAFALMDGILAVATGFSVSPVFDRWWAFLLEGLAGIVIGLFTFFSPNITTTALVYFIGAWAIITGIFEIVSAIQFRKLITGEFMLILGGLLSIVFGVLLFVFPSIGAVSVAWIIGYYAIFFGISEIILGFHMRSLGKDFKNTEVTAS